MKRIVSVFLPVISGMVFLYSCNTTPEEARLPIAPPRIYTREEASYQIIEHKTSNSGESLPSWVSLYIAGEISEIEAFPEYENRYVFIAVNSGTNFAALNQWVSGFMLVQDFPQLIAMRVLSRFIENGQRDPEREYGDYFESAIRTTADAVYSDARKETDFWLLKRYDASEDGATEARNVYDFFILISIAKDQLQSQLNQTLLKAAENITLTRNQNDAVNRLRGNFYEGF